MLWYTSVQTNVKDKEPSFLSEEEIIQYFPDKSIQEKFAEQSFEEKSELMEELPELARPYINMILTNDINLDSTYGVNLNENNELGIGNATLDLDPLGGDIILKKDLEDESGTVSRLVIGEYEGTPGLYSLLFSRNPGYYTKDDKKNYQEILFLSDAIKKAYVGLDRFSHKFKTIIRPFLKEH